MTTRLNGEGYKSGATGRLPWFIRKRLLLFFRRSAFRYGESIPFGVLRPRVLVTSPDDVKHILTSHSANYRKSEHIVGESGWRRLGRGLISTSGSEHHQRRRLLWPSFKRERIISSYTELVLDRIQETTRAWRPGQVINLGEEMSRLTESVILGVLLGRRFAADEGLRLAVRARRRYNEYYYRTHLPWPERWPFPVVTSYRKAKLLINKTLYREIHFRRASDARSPDLMSSFLGATGADGQRLTDDDIVQELLPLTTTGYETTGEGLTWALYLLSRHPREERRLLEETHRFVGRRRPRQSDLLNLGYLERAVAEVLRLFPPTWAYVRVAVEDDVLPSGTRVVRGTPVFLSQYLMHRHPDFYPDPELFRPDRFEGAEGWRRLQFSYFPFGAGAHRCIGEHLATLEMILGLVQILPRYRFEILNRARLKAGLTLAPARPIWARIQPR